MKRKLEYDDLKVGGMVEQKDSPGTFFRVGQPRRVFTGAQYAMVYDVFDGTGRQVYRNATLSFLRDRYHKPKPEKS